MKDPLHPERGLSRIIPLYWLILLVSLHAFLPAAYAQTGMLPIRNGVIDFSGAGHTLVLKVVATVPDLPGTCSDGEIASVTAAAAGSNLYTCTSNAWTQVVSGGGAGSGTVATATQFQVGEYLANGSTISGVSIPDCQDSGGNHVNFNGSTGVYTCGTTSSTPAQLHAVTFVLNGGGSTITTGDSGFYPGSGASTGTINRVDISGGGTAGATCSITVDIWKRNAAIPTSAQKISASAPATLSSANLSQSGSLSGWTTSVAANDVWAASVATVTGCITALVQVWFQ